MYVVIATFDNTDPKAYGPFPSSAEAQAAVPVVRAALLAAGYADHHIEAVSASKLRSLV